MLAATPSGTAEVLEAWDETPAMRGVRIRLPGALAGAHRRPGQLVKLGTPAGESYFALASAPEPQGHADLLLKRGGAAVDAAVAAARPGAELRISAPFGHGFPVEEARGRDVLLFAAGSGIAPIRALVQHLAAHREECGRITLFYGQRRHAEFAYLGEHLAWERRGVRVVLCPSGEDHAWQGVRGRVQEVAASLAFGGAPPGDTVAFVCGMQGMVEDVRRTLDLAGVPRSQVHANL
jgi:NAD(P)H-flavin reductase